MKLRIQNFAKVKAADIILDGITVIAGKNNTGKSTVGKVLDSMYNSTSNLETKMKRARKSRLRSILLNKFNYSANSVHLSPSIIAETVEKIFEAEADNESVYNLERLIEYAFPNNLMMENEKLLKELLDELEEIKAIPDEVFIKVILSNYFSDMFNGNINNVELSDTEAKVEIQIKSGKNVIIFRNDTCLDFSLGYNPVSSSVYLDNPMLLDKLNNSDVMRMPRRYLSEQEYNLYTKLAGERRSAEERAINEIINKEKLDGVIRLLNRVIPGEIVYNQKYEYRAEKGKGGIDIRSMSMGLKSFAILKQLIMNGSLNDKDAVVLDEPEIHLHPEWQMVYAELIVVLQEKFDLNFIINTHSSHFLETLDFYAAKYGRKDICHYYLSEESEGVCGFEEVTDTPEKIYKQLVDPSLLLAREKEKWEEEHESV
ncbi:MAG: ATP-binding protein [Lachnospiraceae bacterium]|nr:ATP-binding protein [Lachnospiraceae bacterium]